MNLKKSGNYLRKFLSYLSGYSELCSVNKH